MHPLHMYLKIIISLKRFITVNTLMRPLFATILRYVHSHSMNIFVSASALWTFNSTCKNYCYHYWSLHTEQLFENRQMLGVAELSM